MKSKYILILFVLSYVYIAGYSQKTITLDPPKSNVPGTYLARDEVTLSDGYSFTSSTTNSMWACTNNSLMLDAEYLTGTNIPDPTTFTPDKSLDFGATAGSLNVTPSGAATYTIPINCPPGVGGMAPTVSLAYSSQSGNGIAGWGFNFSASSAITRVPQNAYNDVYAKGLGLDVNDRFSLDGNRLVCTSGTYGANNSLYRTLNETFSVVKANKVNNTYGPDYFEVHTKNGMKLKYGSNTGKLMYTSGSKTTCVAWFLDYQEDAFGNYVTYTYDQQGLTLYLKKITYGSNTHTSVTNTVTNTVEFYYETRTDLVPVTIANLHDNMNLILNRIQTRTNGQLYREYNLEYKTDIYSRLVRVTESNGTGEKLNPTTFKWGTNNTVIAMSNVTVGAGTHSTVPHTDRYWTSLDFNGDGISDLIDFYKYTSNGSTTSKAEVLLGNRTSGGQISFSQSAGVYDMGTDFNFGKILTPNRRSSIGDINGDNKTDFIATEMRDVNGVPTFFFNTISEKGYDEFHQTVQGRNSDQKAELPNYSIADLSNNGFDDFVILDKNPYQGAYLLDCYMFLYAGTSLISQRMQYSLNLPGKPENMFLTDFNQDGLTDIMVFRSDGFSVFYNKGFATGTPFSATADYTSTSLNSTYELNPGDFNGDGLLDFLCCRKGTLPGEWYLALNNGNMAFNLTRMSGMVACNDYRTDRDDSQDNIIITDYNYDGKSDVIVFDAQYTQEIEIDLEVWYKYHHFTTAWYKSTGNNFTLEKHADSYDESQRDAYSRYFTYNDFNGDGRLDLINFGYDCYNQSETTQEWRIYSAFNTNYESGLITNISNGLGNKSVITYTSLTTKENYDATGYNPTYPVVTASPALTVVKNVSSTNGVANNAINSYSYKNATFHYLFGFLGFGQNTVVNNLSAEKAETYYSFSVTGGALYYNQVYYSPYVVQTKQYVNNVNYQISDITYGLHEYGSKRKFLYSNGSTTNNVFAKNQLVTASQINSDGNLEQSETITKKKSGTIWEAVATKLEKYENYADVITSDLNSIPNAPGKIYTKQEHTDDLNKSFKDSTYIYYNLANGTIESKKAFANKTIPVTTSYIYNDVGNPTKVTTTASNVSRWITTEYDPTWRFVKKTTNIKGHAGESEYDIWGNVTISKNANGLVSSYKYDSWGTLIEKTAPDGIASVSDVYWAATGAPTGALYYSTATVDGTFAGSEYFDAVGRSLRKVSTGYNGSQFYTNTIYNTKGQVYRVSDTYPANSSPTMYTTYAYDGYNRTSTITSQTGVTQTYNYNDALAENKVKVSISANEYSEKLYDAAGLLKEAKDPGGTITYTYDCTGQVKTIQAPGGTTQVTYDEYGRQATLNEPNAGITSYTYTGFGELFTQTDARGNITSMEYDNLGRVTKKTVGTDVTNYTYDEAGALGLLKSIANTNKAGFTYKYDNLGRVKEETRSKGSLSFTYAYEYFIDGKLKTLTYPSGLVLTYQYNSNDDITAIYNNKINTTTPVWQLNLVNSKGLLQQATYGNGKAITYGYDGFNRMNSIQSAGIIDFRFTFNSKSQLTNRTEHGVAESFTYDYSNRLKTVGKASVTDLTMTYQASPNDRISNKSDIGTYNYASTANHKLNTVTTIPGVVLPQHDLTYTPEGKTETLKQTVAGVDTKLATFTYGVDDQRFSMEYKEGTAVKYTRYYYNNYEKEVKADGTVRQLSYISTPNGLTAIFEQVGTTEKMHYIYTDYQGSLKCITDGSGTIEQKLSYDAWGRRRYITGAPYLLPSLGWAGGGFTFARGYTGHEHLDEFGLINMNGRVYDPALALFLSPDPYVQAPDFTQNFNRYSYCLNNPMMYTDPSGEKIEWWHPFTMGLGTASLPMLIKSLQGKEYSVGEWIGEYAFNGTVQLAAAGVGQAACVGLGVEAGMSAGLVGGAAGGFTSGTINGTVSAIKDGQNLQGIFESAMEGGLKEGAIGGITGAIMGGLSTFMDANKHIRNLWTGEITGLTKGYKAQLMRELEIQCLVIYFDQTKLTDGGGCKYNNEYARKFYEKVFKASFRAKAGLIQIYADGRNINYSKGGVTKTLIYDSNNGTYLMDGGNYLGITTTNKASKTASIYLGQKVFKSPIDLYLTMGHELNHVALNYYGLPQSEAICFNWQYQASISNCFDPALSKYFMNQSVNSGWFNTAINGSLKILNNLPNFGISLIFNY